MAAPPGRNARSSGPGNNGMGRRPRNSLIRRGVCIARWAALSFPTCPSACTFPTFIQCGLTRRSTRTSRMRGLRPRAGRRLANSLGRTQRHRLGCRLRPASNHRAKHHLFCQPCSWRHSAATLRPGIGHRGVCVAPVVALSLLACPSARSFAKFTRCGLTRRSRGLPGCVASPPHRVAP